MTDPDFNFELLLHIAGLDDLDIHLMSGIEASVAVGKANLHATGSDLFHAADVLPIGVECTHVLRQVEPDKLAPFLL